MELLIDTSRTSEASLARLGSSVLRAIDDSRDAVLLYGSCARGEQTVHSDIDVLQVVAHRRPSVHCGRLSLMRATSDSLRKLAESGSLFLLHLRTEAVILRDDARVVSGILESYRQPASYEPLRKSLRISAGILDIDERAFSTNPRGFMQLLVYLLRTTLYARCAEEGHPLFSMSALSEYLRDGRLMEIYLEWQRRAGDFDYFLRVRAALEEYLEVRVKNDFESIEALAVQAYGESPLASALALRILGGASLAYEDLLPDGIPI